MASILTLAEQRDGTLRRAALETVSEARRLASPLGASVATVILGPGGKSGKHPHAPSHEEFAFVVKGQATLTLGDEESDLGPGDAVTLPARAPRRWENRTGGTVEVLIVAARVRSQPSRA